MNNARQTAAKALLKLTKGDAWSNLSLDHALEASGLSGGEASFAGALFYGVIERQITLDACIAAHSRLPLDKLSPEVLCALRLSLYQLLYMDSVPDHAAVSEGVSLTRRLRKSSASGYVNGALRSFLRSGKAIPLPKGKMAQMSVEYSCPEPLVSLLSDSYSEEDARRFLAGTLGRPPIAVRVNTLRTTPDELLLLLEKEGVTAKAHPHLHNALLLENTGPIYRLSSYTRGLFHVQDPASQICAEVVGALPSERILDACAAPGGKSFTMAELMNGQGEIVACDLHEKRAGLISRRADEMGLANIKTLTLDMTEYHADLGIFDRVLCDVPCSGYGAIRRRPEIKYKPLPLFSGIPDIQYKILERASQYCKKNGRLIYSTCTLNPAENQSVTARFLQENPDFNPAPLGGLLGDVPSRTLLGEFDGDGFFLAAFARRDR